MTSLQRTSQIRAMPFTGDSSDSESDGGYDGNIRSTSGTRVDSADKVHMNKTRGINPTIINQPPTPLLTRKKHTPFVLGQVQDGVTGNCDHSVASFKPESSAFSPKYASQKFDSHLTSLTSPQSKLYSNNNSNANSFQESVSPQETKPSSTINRTNPNGFVQSSRCSSSKTPTRCGMIASPSKKLGTLFYGPSRRNSSFYRPC